MNSVKNISLKGKMELFFKQRGPILEDWKHTFYLWKSTPLAMIGTVKYLCFYVLPSLHHY